MYVKTYSRDYANALDGLLLDQFKDLANLFVVGGNSRLKCQALVNAGERTIDAIFDRGLDK